MSLRLGMALPLSKVRHCSILPLKMDLQRFASLSWTYCEMESKGTYYRVFWTLTNSLAQIVPDMRSYIMRRNNMGQTPLLLGALKGSTKVVTLLLEAGADIVTTAE